MKNLLLTLSLLFAAYTAGMAQCQAWWMGWSTPNYTATFVDSSGTDPNVTTYAWDFGDGNTSTDQNPTHQYANGGLYWVCFSIETQINGAICRDSYCDSLYVGQQPATCQAYFTATNTPNGNLLYYFSNYSQNSGGSTSYIWDFGDGSTSISPNPSHTYASTGIFNVCLTVNVGSNGAIVCSNQYCSTITVSAPQTCSAVFGYQNTGLTAYFSGPSNGYSHSWDFGDSTVTVGAINPTHYYTTSGTYTVCLTVVDSTTLCTDTYCTNVTVTGSNSSTCTAQFVANYANNTNTAFQFTNYSTGSSNNLTYLWNFGDGDSSTQVNPSHTYSQAGTYTVCLTVTDATPTSLLCSDTYCITVQAGNGTNQYMLQGIVWSDSMMANVWSETTVYLIEFDSASQTLTAVDSTSTLNGYYQFTNVAPGNYLLKAALLPSAPAYADFVPTYYQSELFWYDAATVTVPNSPTSPYYHIYMIGGNNTGGPGFVGGNVNQGANKQASGDPLQNVQIMLLNMDDSPVQYTYSDASGAFSFDDVAYGTYKVYAEVLGKPTYPAIVTISAQKESVEDVALVVEEEGVYSSVSEVDVTFLSETAFFPNPVHGMGNLVFNAKEAGEVEVSVINMLGQVVLQQSTTVQPGNQHFSLELGNQHTGMYIVTISYNNHVAAHIRIIRD